MKSILKKVAGVAVAVTLALGMFGCSDGSDDEPVSDFVLIPAGTFQMGSNQGNDDNKPVHTVTLTKAFYMCDHEVTQAEYEAVMGEGSNPSTSETGAAEGEVQENRPVETISWYMAIVYCNKRSIKEGLTPCYTIGGKIDPAEWGSIPNSSDATWDAVTCNWTANGYRLPTEAEWEYAARAGVSTVDSPIWSGTNTESNIGEYAWIESNSNDKTHEVKKKKPNAWGLYDMTGNVWEWCWERFLRGCGYDSFTYEARIFCHFSLPPESKDRTTGFRVVRTAN